MSLTIRSDLKPTKKYGKLCNPLGPFPRSKPWRNGMGFREFHMLIFEFHISYLGGLPNFEGHYGHHLHGHLHELEDFLAKKKRPQTRDGVETSSPFQNSASVNPKWPTIPTLRPEKYPPWLYLLPLQNIFPCHLREKILH